MSNLCGVLPSVARFCQHTFIDSLLDANSVVVDLGANRGDFSGQTVNRWGCTVYAVEPVPALFAQIEEHPKIKKFNYAISSTNQIVSLNLLPNRCASTYRLFEESETAVVSVRGVTLETFLTQNDVRVIDLLKIDIEGSELELFLALDPARFEQIGQITVEFHDFLFPAMRLTVEAVKRHIGARGFYCIPFSRDNTDVLFVNKRKITRLEYVYMRCWVRNYTGLRRMMARRFWQIVRQ